MLEQPHNSGPARDSDGREGHQTLFRVEAGPQLSDLVNDRLGRDALVLVVISAREQIAENI